MSEDSSFDEIKKLFPPEVFDPEFSEKALRHFQDLKEKAEGGDEEAKRELAACDRASEKIRNELSKKFNISEQEVRRIMTNEQNFSKEEWARIQDAKKEMTPVVQEAQKGKKKKKKRTAKEDKWLKS